MSKYTTQLRWIVEQTLNDAGKPLTEDSWPYVYKTLGLDDYPLFDETYRETLNNKIIRHYYTREIGAETVGRFRMFIRDAMHLIMPYYNQLVYLKHRKIVEAGKSASIPIDYPRAVR